MGPWAGSLFHIPESFPMTEFHDVETFLPVETCVLHTISRYSAKN